LQREGLTGPQTLVREHAHQRCIRRPQLSADRLDRLRRARVDRVVADVRESPHTEDGVPMEASPLDRAVEDALEQTLVRRRCARDIDEDGNCAAGMNPPGT
jgi:hypothetical protein